MHKTYYYKLDEFMNKWLTSSQVLNVKVGEDIGTPSLFKKFLQSTFTDISSISPTFLDNTYIKEVFVRFCNRYWDEYIVRSDDILTTDADFSNAFVPVMSKLVYLLRASLNRYTEIISAYTKKKDQLLSQISSTNTSTFTDAPQTDIQTKIIDEDHVSTITKNVIQTDGSSPVARINEIERLYDDAYDRWVVELGDAVIYYI